MQFASHPNSCPICLEHQGKTYSIHGQTPGYPKVDEAEADGVGHPNCKCEWVLIYDDDKNKKSMFEVATTTALIMYELDQKRKALERTIKDYETDLELYQYIGNNEMVDKTTDKLTILSNQLMI